MPSGRHSRLPPLTLIKDDHQGGASQTHSVRELDWSILMARLKMAIAPLTAACSRRSRPSCAPSLYAVIATSVVSTMPYRMFC